MSYIIKTTEYLLSGLAVTLKLYIVTIIFSIPLGFLCAFGKLSKHRWLKGILEFYTWLFRGTPLLLQLFFIYFGLAVRGIKLTQFQAASITFVLNYGAYFTEIFRGGIQSVDKGQLEAAKALGMNYWQTMIRIVLPQAVKIALPSTSNEAITLIKDTALVAAIGMGDVLRAAKEVSLRDFKITSFVIATIIYLILTSFIVYIFKRLENKYSVYE